MGETASFLKEGFRYMEFHSQLFRITKIQIR